MQTNNNLEYNPPTFFWVSIYKDDTALPQFDPESGRENLFKDIDQTKLKEFGWYPFTPELASKLQIAVKINPFLPKYKIVLAPNQRLIALRRQFINYGFVSKGEPFEKERKTIYLLGWQETVNGRNHKSILFIDEDGNVEISENFNWK